jgi:hypothetical protein
MPQPFLPTFENKRYAVGANYIIERPKFAAAICHCISLWSYVDNEIGGLFGILLGTNSPGAYRVFLALHRWANQRQALRAAADGVLSGNELATYKALLTEYGSMEKQRNELAHGCFGICPDDEELLFVINVEHHVLWQADIIPRLASLQPIPDPHQGLKDKMYVYRLDDLNRLHSQMEQLWYDIFYFNGYLREPTNPHRIVEFQRVLNSSHIQRHITNP